MFVYVLRSDRNPARHYVGLTDDVEERLKQHNSGGSFWTVRLRPWTLVVSVRFVNDDRARAFERFLKTGSGRAFCPRHF